MEYPNQDVKKELEAIATLRKSLGEAEVNTSVLLLEMKRTFQQQLQKIDSLLVQLLSKFPTVTDEDIRTITDTQKDLRDKHRLTPAAFTFDSNSQLATVKYDFLDREFTITYARGSNREITTKSVNVVEE